MSPLSQLDGIYQDFEPQEGSSGELSTVRSMEGCWQWTGFGAAE
jgi:hypothetical protein